MECEKQALGWQEMERKPPWLRAKIPGGPEYLKVRNLVQENRLHTVCE
ncbi:MAG: lipoyl synthase, partial [Verrucomicrobiota bacterium]